MFLSINLRKFKRLAKYFVVMFSAIICFTIIVSLYFPLKHLDVIVQYSQEYGLRTELVCAVIRAESRFDVAAVSSRGASGLMQIMKQTADWAAEEIGIEAYSYDQILEPGLNIRIGCWYLNRLIKQYDNNEATALAAYNAGSGNVSKWLLAQDEKKDLESIPFPETKVYLKRVQQFERAYRILLKFYN